MDAWDLNLRHLRAFEQTCELGTVVAASRAINLSQPAVTQAINRIETQLAENLFERRPDGMIATEAAELFLPRVSRALSMVPASRMTSTQARAFLALARAGSYVDAARRLGIAKASLHRAVSDLELSLGLELVRRRGRGLELTAKGRTISRSLRLAQVELEAGLSEVAALRSGSAGRIRIGAMPLCRARILPTAAVSFLERHPGVDLVILEGAHNDLIEPLRDGDLDLLIGALRDQAPAPDVSQLALFTDRPAIVARRDHPALLGSTPTSLDALTDYDWIVPPGGVPLREQWNEMFDQAGLERPSVPVECASVITIREILMKSDRLTLLSPDQVAVELEAGWLTVISTIPTGLSRVIGLTTRTDWRPTLPQQAFLDALLAVTSTQERVT